MTIFGDTSSFAIEAMIEPHLVPPSIPWGRMRIWCQGVSLGNFDDEHCGLDQSFDGLHHIASQLDSYWLDEFASMPPIEIIDLLDAHLFGWCGDEELEDERSLEEIRKDVDRYGRFSIMTNWGEQFDGIEKPFILCPPNWSGPHSLQRVRSRFQFHPSHNSGRLHFGGEQCLHLVSRTKACIE